MRSIKAGETDMSLTITFRRPIGESLRHSWSRGGRMISLFSDLFSTSILLLTSLCCVLGLLFKWGTLLKLISVWRCSIGIKIHDLSRPLRVTIAWDFSFCFWDLVGSTSTACTFCKLGQIICLGIAIKGLFCFTAFFVFGLSLFGFDAACNFGGLEAYI